MKKFGLFLIVATIGFFAACSSDKKHDEVDPTDYAKEIEGKYWGDLEVTLPGSTAIPSKDNIILERTKDNTVKLQLKDFHLEDIEAGDITLNDVEVAKDGENIVLKEKSEKITLTKLGGVTATVTVTGKVVGKKIDLKLNITDVAVFPKQTIKVTFIGNKLDNPNQDVSFFDMEEWIQENEGEKDETKQFFIPVGGWSSSNTGVSFIMLWGSEIPGAYFNVVKTDDAKNGKSAARIETLDTKGINLGFVKVPKVTSGTLFTGAFKTDALNTLNSTKFGVPFTKKPLKLSGYYKYTPGKEFLRSSVATADEGVSEPNTKDKCAIAAYLYEYDAVKAAEDEALGEDNPYSTYLTGTNIKTSDAVIAIAELKDGSEKKEYTLFNEEFKYKAGKKYDKSKTYRLAIVTSSSAEGDTFSGAPGSVLYLDDIEIISE